jgi:TolB-like protein/thioredoxin-like negative regulator of GroEL
MDSRDNGIIRFDRFELDPGRAEFRCDGQTVAVEPKVLDLIVHLASHPGELQSRDDLIDAVWGGTIVSDSAISSCIASARKALGDDGKAQRYIRSIPRRGFRFDAEIQAGDWAAPALPDRPSVAVLPFQNMSGDPDQVYFSDGITDDIITDLSRYDELFVIARHSSFSYRDSPLEAREIARALGVQYLAEGNVRRAGNRIRVTARLIDPWAGNELWAERYDRELTDIFEVQDDISSVIVNTLAGQIARQHYKKSLSKSPEAVDAYDHVLQALELLVRVGPEENRRAREEAEKALSIAPKQARAHAIVAWSYISEASNFWGIDPVREFDMAYQAALAAVTADDREPLGHSVLGWVYQWRDRAHERAIGEHERAVSLNPGSAYYRSYHAFALTYAGQSELALDELETAMRLDPHYPALYQNFYARALFSLHRYEDAVPHLQRVRTEMPGNANALALAAACYAALDSMDEARDTVAEIQKASKAYTLSHARQWVPYRLTSDLEHFLSMLSKAGLPE